MSDDYSLGPNSDLHPLGEFLEIIKERREGPLPIYSVTLRDGMQRRDGLGRIIQSDLNNEDNLFAAKNDICYNMMRMWQGASGIAPEDCLVSPAYVVCRPKEDLLPNFAAHLLKSEQAKKSFVDRSQGVTSDRWRLYPEEFLKIRLPIPPLPEQKKIAEILSGIDQRTNSLKKKKQKLENIYRACSSNFFSAVGKQVPLREACDLQVGFAFRSTDFGEDGIRLLRGENVGYGKPDWSKTQFLPPALSELSSQYYVEAGDIVIGMDRSFTKSGFKVSRIAEKDLPCLLVQRVGRFLPKEIRSGYLWHILQSVAYQKILSASEKGMDIPHLSKSEILEPTIPLADDEHQCHITNSLDSLVNSIDAITCSIETTNQLSIALRSDLLSGRKRVSI